MYGILSHTYNYNIKVFDLPKWEDNSIISMQWSQIDAMVLINAPRSCVKKGIQERELLIMYTMPWVFNLFGTLVINLIKHKVLNFSQSTP